MKINKRRTNGDQVFHIATMVFLLLLAAVILYPLVYVLSASFSDANMVAAGKIYLLPKGLNLEGYKAVFQYKKVLRGYANTIFYTVVGTFINIVLTMTCAYPLSRPDMQWKRFYSIFFLITMFFGGGLIPTYILVSKLHLTNTVAIMLIGSAISVYNMIVCRTFLQTNIPRELLDSSLVDGCNDYQYFFRIVLPLSKAILAVLALYYAVAHWNSYFNAMIYLNDLDKYPLQLFLRQILVMNQVNPSDMMDPSLLEAKKGMSELLKYSLIVVSTVPIMFIYPFVQKHFAKGVMIGSIKG